MKVPFVDLHAQYLSIKNEIDNAILQVMEESIFIGGRFVLDFEKEFADKYGVKHCIGVANGTDAIYITLKMLGIGLGDEVITVANSWISTSSTITQAGARPVFVDIEEDFFTIDPKKIISKITPKTKAIIPVHLYGGMAQMEEIVKICQEHNLYLIEDCAQSHFSEYKGKRAGTFGIAGTFSFYPSKNLGAYGDAGCIITNDDVLAVKIRKFANHGALEKHQHVIEGINSHLDTIQASILAVKLKYLEKWNSKRIANAKIYNRGLSDIKDILLPKVRENTKHTFHLYVIRSYRRNELRDFLKENGIETSIHYPSALPNLKAYEYLSHSPNDFPVASQYQTQILSLPMFPELSEEQIFYVCEKIKEFYS